MKKCREWLANLRLKTKFLLILCVSLLFSSVVTLLTAFAVFHQYDEELYRNTSQLLSMAVDAVESDLGAIDQAGVWVVANSDIQMSLGDPDIDFVNREPVIAFGQASQKIYEALNQYTGKSSYVNSASIYVDGQRFSVGQSYTRWPQEDVERLQRLAAKGKGQAVWVSSGKPDGELCYTREIRNINSMKLQVLGFLVLRIDLKGMVDDRLKNSPNLSYAPQLTMLDGEGVTLFEDFPVSQPAESFPGENGFRRAKLAGEDYFITYATQSRFGFQYATYLPIGAIASTLRLLNLAVLLAALLAILASMGLSSLLASQIIRHFHVLVEKMRLFTEGKLQEIKQYPYANRRDELGYLHRSFDQMAEDFNALVEDNYVKRLAIKEARIRSLQNQLNPHFLFNILQTITWKARAGKGEEISQITEALGKILRYSLREQEDLVPLGTELAITESYCAIQQYRYGERLQVRFTVAEEFYGTPVPPMALQNLVENAIKHALENMLEACCIQVGAAAEGNTVCLFVEDNGPGIDENILGGGTKSVFPKLPNSTGIGLANLAQRMEILLGEPYGLKIHNTGHGARVELWLPRKPDEKPARLLETERERGLS